MATAILKSNMQANGHYLPDLSQVVIYDNDIKTALPYIGQTRVSVTRVFHNVRADGAQIHCGAPTLGSTTAVIAVASRTRTSLSSKNNVRSGCVCARPKAGQSRANSVPCSTCLAPKKAFSASASMQTQEIEPPVGYTHRAVMCACLLEGLD
jgi:hypothetical protein